MLLRNTSAARDGRARYQLGRHLSTGLSASATCINAVLHVTKTLAVLGAFFAYLSAFSAGVLVVR